MIKITDREFNMLSRFIRSNYGIDLKEEKKTLVMTRLNRVLAENNFENFSEYYKYIISDKSGQALNTLVDKITTNHTFFMREANHFYFFRDQVLPYLNRVVKNRDLRIWSAGCSTGEEAYTLAMLIDEYFGKEKFFWDTRILATDISNKVLRTAEKGIYRDEKISTLPYQWKMNYFKNYDKKNSILIDKIRNEVIFRKFNLMDDIFPFRRRFHGIFCRNVMIYFDQQTRIELVNKLYDLLEWGGYLFIGHSESLNRGETKFKYIVPAVYRKE